MGHLAISEAIVQESNGEAKVKKYSEANGDSQSFEVFSYFKDRVCKKLSSTASKIETDEYKKVDELIETLSFAHICKALFIDMKWKPELNEEFTVTEFVENNNLTRSYIKLLITLLRRLAERGILSEQTEVMLFKVLKLPPNDTFVLNEIKRIQELLLDNPSWSQEASCIDYFGSHLYPVIAGKEAGLKILFPHETETLNYPYGAKSLYENSYVMKLTKVIPTITGIEEYLQILTNNNAITDKIRILEIGAGTAGTTIPLLESFKNDTFDKLEYDFTDISNFFVCQAQARIQSKFPDNLTKCIEFKTLDIETDPKEQGFELGSYDIVLAADVFHATEYLDDTVSHARSLLKPNGLLVLGEIFQSRMGIEIIFGLTSGWWNWSDKFRKNYSPLLNPKEWDLLLKNHGFSDSFAVGDGTYGVIFAFADNVEYYV